MRFLPALFALSAALCAQPLDRTRPPVTPAAPDYKLPATFETKLPNGLGVTLVEDHRFPLVTLRLGWTAGSRTDPQDSRGSPKRWPRCSHRAPAPAPPNNLPRRPHP